jgi:hypothetical protein
MKLLIMPLSPSSNYCTPLRSQIWHRVSYGFLNEREQSHFLTCFPAQCAPLPAVLSIAARRNNF